MTDKHVVLRNSAGTSDLFYFPYCDVRFSIGKKNTMIPSKSGLIAKDIGYIEEDSIVITSIWTDDHIKAEYDGLTAFARYKALRALTYTAGTYQLYIYSTRINADDSETVEEETLKVVVSGFQPTKEAGQSGSGKDIPYNFFLTVTKK